MDDGVNGDKLTLAMIREAKEKLKAQPMPEGLYVTIDGVEHIDLNVWMELSCKPT